MIVKSHVYDREREREKEKVVRPRRDSRSKRSIGERSIKGNTRPVFKKVKS